WLTKPDWASVQGRAEFIFSLTEIDAPESIPGLLWVLDNDDDDYIRDAVVEALAQHCDSRLAPALKGILPTESNEDVRWQIVTALAKCGGFSDEELASAIEAFANVAAKVEDQQAIKEILSGESETSLSLNVITAQALFKSDLKVTTGQALFESDMSWATEGFATILFDRLKELRPGSAKLILDKIRALPLNVARAKLIERIGAGRAKLHGL